MPGTVPKLGVKESRRQHDGKVALNVRDHDTSSIRLPKVSINQIAKKKDTTKLIPTNGSAHKGKCFQQKEDLKIDRSKTNTHVSKTKHHLMPCLRNVCKEPVESALRWGSPVTFHLPKPQKKVKRAQNTDLSSTDTVSDGKSPHGFKKVVNIHGSQSEAIGLSSSRGKRNTDYANIAIKGFWSKEKVTRSLSSCNKSKEDTSINDKNTDQDPPKSLQEHPSIEINQRTSSNFDDYYRRSSLEHYFPSQQISSDASRRSIVIRKLFPEQKRRDSETDKERSHSYVRIIPKEKFSNISPEEKSPKENRGKEQAKNVCSLNPKGSSLKPYQPSTARRMDVTKKSTFDYFMKKLSDVSKTDEGLKPRCNQGLRKTKAIVWKNVL